MEKYGVLFVCTGNICRSPTAEAVLRDKIKKNSWEKILWTDSAGTHGYHVGDPPDARAAMSATSRGYAMQDLYARRFVQNDFSCFGLVLAMDEGHYKILESMRPANINVDLRLFMDFVPQSGRSDVPDPYYGGDSDFEYALDLIEQGVDGLIDHLRQELIF